MARSNLLTEPAVNQVEPGAEFNSESNGVTFRVGCRSKTGTCPLKTLAAAEVFAYFPVWLSGAFMRVNCP